MDALRPKGKPHTHHHCHHHVRDQAEQRRAEAEFRTQRRATQKVEAMRLNGCQNPDPLSHSATIDHMAIIIPPTMPASAPRTTVRLFTSLPPLLPIFENHQPAETRGSRGSVGRMTVF